MKKSNKKLKEEKKYTEIFLIIAITFVVCNLISNILCSKIINIFGITCTAGILVFPITYIIGDVLTEVYGYKTSKKIIIYGFIFNAFATLLFLIAIKLPFPPFWENQDAFVKILGNTYRVYLASVTGYLVGGFSNAFIMHYIKNNTKIKFLWFRAIVSTIIGESLDTIIFLTISFFGIYTNNELISMIFYQSLFKILYETIFIPITYFVIKKIKLKEGLNE